MLFDWKKKKKKKTHKKKLLFWSYDLHMLKKTSVYDDQGLCCLVTKLMDIVDYEWKAKTLMKLCGCTDWFESAHFSYVRKFRFAWYRADTFCCPQWSRITQYIHTDWSVNIVAYNAHHSKQTVRPWLDVQTDLIISCDLFKGTQLNGAGLGGSVGCAIRLDTRRSQVQHPRRSQQSFVETDHEIFSTVILSLPLIQEEQLSVSGERMCTILVNRLED